MKNLFKRMSVMILAVATVLAMSIPAFAATQERQNAKTSGGAVLIGNTLVVNEDNHQFFIYGKSVMAQCNEFTDIIPNNETRMIDVLYNGNVFKGVEELMVIKQKNKDDKVVLEEGSMIVTGINTLEQLAMLKNVVAVNPQNLAELKYNMALNDVTLGLTKAFAVTKDGITNENGKSVNPKDIEGTAELITKKQIEDTAKEELRKDAEKEQKITPTAKPESGSSLSPHRKGCTHIYDLDGRVYVKCIKGCGQINPYSRGCNHEWDNDGRCTKCHFYCLHEFPEGMTGAACEICGYNPSVGPAPSAPPVCLHTLGFEDIDSDEVHGCRGCFATFSHRYNADGRCEDCNHVCTHGDTTIGTCGYCGKVLSVPIGCPNEANHASLHIGIKCPSCDYIGNAPHAYVANNDISHKCSSCGGDISLPHTYVSGTCTECEHVCAHEGLTSGECPLCHLTIGSCPNEANHASLHQGVICQTCFDYVGTAPHHWTNKTGYCDECNAPCSWCSGEGTAGGCSNCGKDTGGCSLAASHSTLHVDQLCFECEYPGTVPHTWIDAHDGTHECSCGCCEYHEWLNGVCTGCSATHDCSSYSDGKCSVCGKYCPDCNNDSDSIDMGNNCPTCGLAGTHEPCPHLSFTPSDETYHRCDGCFNLFAHEWFEGHCSLCGLDCPRCHGNGAIGECEICGYE